MWVNLIGRICISFFGWIACEFLWFLMIGLLGIGNGRGEDGLGEVILWFIVGSLLVTPTSIIFSWSMTANHKMEKDE